MPQYFYHLKFELYPNLNSPIRSANPSTITRAEEEEEEEEDRQREIWIPTNPRNSHEEVDIFDSAIWPRHKPVLPETPRFKFGFDSEYRELDLRWDRHQTTRGSEGKGTGTGVIDCGPVRAQDKQKQHYCAGSSADADFPPPNTRNIQSSLESARRDWRFGRVRVESWDLDLNFGSGTESRLEGLSLEEEGQDIYTDIDRMESPELGRKRGESSGVASGMTVGGLAAAGGRATKARFEEGKNTEVGWGVVHLYRDGENAGSSGGVEIYSSDSTAIAGEDGYTDEAGKDEDFTTLCIPAVPSYLTPSDFLGFVGEKTREEVSHFRMVMTGRMNRYLVLMKFRDGSVARKWKSEWDGKVFNSMEPETCHVTFIKSITFQTPTSTSTTSFPELAHDPFTPYLKPFPPPTPNLVELPTCPVCLERMDDTTGLLTILCQHVFHCSCLQKWRGSGCPVCRHTNPSPSLTPSPYTTDPPFGNSSANLCNVCDSTTDLWICLICGLVGCGRYKGGHAKEHWKETAHNFALEIETQHVWDYAGDLWVHRLIRDKGNGKVVEFPSSSNLSRGGHHDGGMTRMTTRTGEDDMEMVPREKLDRIGIEYTHLLTSQLESQRVYFEDLVNKAVSKASAATSSANIATSQATDALSRLRSLEIENRKLKDETIANLEKDLAREKRKAEKSSEVARGFGKSLMEEKKVSEGLMERIEHLNVGMMGVSKELTVLKGENEDLREENRDLLFSITAGEKLRGMEGEGGVLEEGELEGGTVGVPTEKEKRKGKGRRK